MLLIGLVGGIVGLCGLVSEFVGRLGCWWVGGLDVLGCFIWWCAWVGLVGRGGWFGRGWGWVVALVWVSGCLVCSLLREVGWVGGLVGWMGGLVGLLVWLLVGFVGGFVGWCCLPWFGGEGWGGWSGL